DDELLCYGRTTRRKTGCPPRLCDDAEKTSPALIAGAALCLVVCFRIMPMPCHDLVFLAEDPSYDAAIDLINQEAFGPGRFVRAAERVREQGPHDRGISFVAADKGE